MGWGKALEGGRALGRTPLVARVHRRVCATLSRGLGAHPRHAPVPARRRAQYVSRALSRQNVALALPSPSKAGEGLWAPNGAMLSSPTHVPLPSPYPTSLSSGPLYRRREEEGRGRAHTLRFAFWWPPCPPVCLCEGWCRKKPEKYLGTVYCFYKRFFFVASWRLVGPGHWPCTGCKETLCNHKLAASHRPLMHGLCHKGRGLTRICAQIW